MAARLEGRVAFITGAGMGIGRETALLFAEEGAGVVVGDIDANAAKETVALVEGRGGRAPAPLGDAPSGGGGPPPGPRRAPHVSRPHRPRTQHGPIPKAT